MSEINKEYIHWLTSIKSQIRSSQIKAALAVNSELIRLYWDLGRQMIEKQQTTNWGTGFVIQLSKDLKNEFPDMGGWSRTNLFRVQNFYLFYSEQIKNNNAIIPQLVGQLGIKEVPQLEGQIQNGEYEQVLNILTLLPWGHNILILEKLKEVEKVFFYLVKTIENNWSRSVLEYQIESNLYARQAKAITNFSASLPIAQSDLATSILKDPYNFEFLALSEKARETDLEKALVQHISKFLMELGKGFAYMGRQYLLKLGNKEYRTDLLFYHTKLKCYVIIELKVGAFQPEFVGKLNFYISAINELEKDSTDNPTIGILLCKNKDDFEVEFTLKDIQKPIGVSTFNYKELSKNIQEALPSDKELENEIKRFDLYHGK